MHAVPRVLQKPERLEVMNGGQRLFHAAESGEHNRWSKVAVLLQVLKKLETVHARHDQIRNDDIRTKGGETFQRFLPVRRKLRLKAIIGEHGGQSGTLALVIIDDQDPARICRFSGHRINHNKPY